MIEAAPLPLAGLTAVQTLDKVSPQPGERVLVTGAAGGVGGVAVQLAHHAGALVDTLVSRPQRVSAAGDLGAHVVVRDPAALPEAAYQVVFDTAGADVARALAPSGRYVSISDDPLPDLAGAVRSHVQEDGRQLADLVTLIDQGKLRLRVADRYPMEQVRAAHERFEAGGLLGKIVLTF